MTSILGNRREHLARAKELIKSSRLIDLHYAALELRMCLEAMTYEKLNSFAKLLPRSFLDRTWQPPQLLKAMKQLDESADQSLELHMGPPVVDGVVPSDDEYQLIGKHKSFSHKWLNKHYHKLGSLLHLRLAGGVNETDLRTFLIGVAAEIEEAQNGLLLGICLSKKIDFLCVLCNETSSVSDHYARTERIAICLNPACELEYMADIEGEQIFLKPLLVTLECKGCGKPIRIQERHLADGVIAECPTCKHQHQFGCKWGYRSMDPRSTKE